ncbi:hypothetical protein LC55x_5456 [Lysobacter capsici]|nr:hypothetical protein LC55x_5456 [Lysobacter capsici]
MADRIRKSRNWRTDCLRDRLRPTTALARKTAVALAARCSSGADAESFIQAWPRSGLG